MDSDHHHPGGAGSGRGPDPFHHGLAVVRRAGLRVRFPEKAHHRAGLRPARLPHHHRFVLPLSDEHEAGLLQKDRRLSAQRAGKKGESGGPGPVRPLWPGHRLSGGQPAVVPDPAVLQQHGFQHRRSRLCQGRVLLHLPPGILAEDQRHAHLYRAGLRRGERPVLSGAAAAAQAPVLRAGVRRGISGLSGGLRRV